MSFFFFRRGQLNLWFGSTCSFAAPNCLRCKLVATLPPGGLLCARLEVFSSWKASFRFTVSELLSELVVRTNFIMGSVAVSHPLDALSADEVTAAATAVRAAFEPAVRFCSISLLEPTLSELRSGSTALPRKALVVLIIPSQAKSYEAVVVDGQVLDTKELPEGTQPPFSPDDCFLAEKIVKDGIADVMRDRYGVEDLSLLACDPWSTPSLLLFFEVHLLEIWKLACPAN